VTGWQTFVFREYFLAFGGLVSNFKLYQDLVRYKSDSFTLTANGDGPSLAIVI
jgi:hypothetical protein